MAAHRSLAATFAAVCVGVAMLVAAPRIRAAADTLPTRLTDAEFWKLSSDMSEPDGYFRSDNLLSNEIWLQYVLKDLLARAKPDGVYLGVGPEQNFTYITNMKPKMVFITDVRRGNMHTHLMYKALFEMSKNRNEFVSRLFSKPLVTTITEQSTAKQIADAYWDAQTSPEAVYKANLQAIKDHLTKSPHQLPLSETDLQGIEYVYYNFYWFGPSITYSSSQGNGRNGNMADWHTITTGTDGTTARGFLATEESFRFMKDLESRNMLVPVVGNFAGPKALRAVGNYVRDHGATITAFYLSNVEQYLNMDGIWNRFCANVATMPLDENSTFIRSSQGGGGGGGNGLINQLGFMKSETAPCAAKAPTPPSSR